MRSDPWPQSVETGQCRGCQGARLALDLRGKATVGDAAVRLLSTSDPGEHIAAVIEALTTGRHLEAAVFVPTGPTTWRVIRAGNQHQQGDEVAGRERFPELAEARRTGRPVRRLLAVPFSSASAPPVPETATTVALAFPIWVFPDSADPLVLRVDGVRSDDSSGCALVVLLAHLLSHRLSSIDGETLARQLGCRALPRVAESSPKLASTGRRTGLIVDRSPETGKREKDLREALDQKMEELAEANHSLEQRARLGTRLISDAAHELRTPVAILRSYLETLTTDLADGLTLEHREFLRGALAGADRLQIAVDELLDVAALESGDVALDVGPVPLGEVLLDIQRVLVPAAARGGVSVRIDPCDPLIVRADRVHLERILHAAIGAAVRFTAGGGVVKVTSRAGAGEVRTTVEAPDVGLDAGDLEHAFDPFYRARRAPATTGFSLGLVRARRLSHLLGSRLDLETMPSGGVRIVFTVALWTMQP